MSSEVPPPAFEHFLPMSQVKPQAIRWLCPGRLALGKLAMLEGDPGLGKSLVAIDLCARLSTGRPFPDGSPCPAPGTALVLDSEDDLEKTTLPRMKAAGADLDRVIHLKAEVNAEGEPLQFPAHLDKLDEMLRKTHAQLLVVSPLGAFVDPVKLGVGDPGVRRALSPLARLAEKHACAVKLIRHLTKKGNGPAVHRGGGSIGFIAACRSGWLVTNDPENARRRVLAQVKNNLAEPQPSLAFEIQAHESGQPVVNWLGICAWRADQLVGLGRSVRLRLRNHAREFLKAFLADGAKTSREVWKAAQDQGLSARTVHRARKEEDVRTLRLGVREKQVCYWLLAGQLLPPELAAHSDDVDLEPYLAPLRAAFPPSTPLDDV